MSKILRLFVLFLAVLGAQACTSAHLKPVADPQQAMKPQQGKALVVFMRPSAFGGAIQSTVYDGENYISTVSSGTRVAYQADPGEHMFMVIGESADFMKATLDVNKTYYALVSARMGLWKARFSFTPVRKSESRDQLNEWLNATTLMEANAEGLQWAKENQQDITNKHNEYLPQWQHKDKAGRDAQTLFAEDGR